MIYQPREDSYLLNDHIKSLKLQGKDFLEVGVGSGLITRSAVEKGAEVTASDINREALDRLDEDVKKVESDLFENIEGEFDFIVFNPPYLPGDKEETEIDGSETWYGGETGVEVTRRFLETCGEHLKENGQVLMVASSLSEYEDLVERFDLDTVETEPLFFEKLLLLRYSLE